MQPSERDSAALTSPRTDTAGKPVSGDPGGLAVPPVVAAVLAVTPLRPLGDGKRVVMSGSHPADYGPFVVNEPDWGAPAPIAARQAAEVLRYMLDNADQVREFYSVWHWMAAMADELDPTPTPTEPAFPRRIVDELDPKETR